MPISARTEFCMLLPGPDTTTRYLHRLALAQNRGGIVAGACFLSTIFILWALVTFTSSTEHSWIAAVLWIETGVLAIVARRSHSHREQSAEELCLWTIAAAAFVAIYFFHVPFP